MKMHWVILLLYLFCSVSFAEYKELEALKQSSHQALMGHAQRLAAVDPKFEGAVKFGQTLQAINDETKVDVAKFTYKSKHYWRAVLEMTPQDSSILFGITRTSILSFTSEAAILLLNSGVARVKRERFLKSWPS